MNTNLVRQIDRNVGPFVNIFLLSLKTLHAKLYRKKDINDISIKNILIIKFFGMGSILLFSPTLQLIKEKYKNAKVTILTLTANEELCKMLPSIDRILCLNMDSLFKFISLLSKHLKHIRKDGYDLIINLEFLTNFSTLISLLSSIFLKNRIIIGFNSPFAWKNKINDINIAFGHGSHITKIFLKIANSLDIKADAVSFENEKKALLEHGDKNYQALLIKKYPFLNHCNSWIVINVNAGELCMHRRWPKQYFVTIIEALQKRTEAGIFLIGNENELGYTTELINMLGDTVRIVNLCGQIKIDQLIDLLMKCKLFITNDSGLLHIATVMEVNTVSFFGPETPALYGPIAGKHYVFYGDTYCSPCINIYNSKLSLCKDNICLTAISPKMVLKVLSEYFQLI